MVGCLRGRACLFQRGATLPVLCLYNARQRTITADSYGNPLPFIATWTGKTGEFRRFKAGKNRVFAKEIAICYGIGDNDLGLANRRFRPLSHPSAAIVAPTYQPPPNRGNPFVSPPFSHSPRAHGQ